jgi:hypothetical protein
MAMSTSTIDIVTIEESLEISPDDIKITGFEDVASYNWLDKPNPTILVPGISPLLLQLGLDPE